MQASQSEAGCLWEKELEKLCVEKRENGTWQMFNPDATMENFSCNYGKTDKKIKKR